MIDAIASIILVVLSLSVADTYRRVRRLEKRVNDLDGKGWGNDD